MQHLQFPSVVVGVPVLEWSTVATSTAHRWFPSEERCRSQVSNEF